MSDFLDRAIEAHVQWKMRLSAAIVGNACRTIDKAVVCTDTNCELGTWIHGEGGEYAGNADFESLKKAHRAFHASIGKVLSLAEASQTDAAKEEMRSGEFKKFSTEVALCITKIKSSKHFKVRP